ncbi:MAG: sigma-70 family RNA polymerase sigma factor [Candidatus Viridilinea halotolerans]|uniref:Sigma-70 family RNA polymerase sigma factor n=1 Tax=Candidatus Viridilinea halotolerans TaxID=2491704 RepID=A0A426U675_9CHLR|nr:MAG: sigma-70 family RNA polymerase sigma factor [Candidatus Viridilinea halotolerans]
MTALPLPSDLIRRAQAADPQALATIYEHFAPRVYRYAYGYVNDYDLASDIQSEVFLRMLESIGNYEDRGWSISSWIYRITQARTMDTLRSKQRYGCAKLDEENVLIDGPEILMGTAFENKALRRAVQRLCAPQRRVILLRHVYGLSIEETARQMGRSIGSVKATHHRAIVRLNALMRTELEE